jgi:ATPase family associated with various cellular activities (AAA)
MAEPLHTMPRQAAPAHASGPASRLSREVAILGARLARLLERVAPGRDATLESSRSFLEAMFEDAAAGQSLAEWEDSAFERRPSGPAQPLDRLTDGLGLIPLEVELLLLAAMPEEHEGYASVLRNLNPRGEGHASVGLAAQLLCRDGNERIEFRDQLLGGTAVRTGLVGFTGEGGFFEQNLVLAAGLWPVLGGLDVWPAELALLTPSSACAGLKDWLDSAAVRRVLCALQQPEPRVLVLGADSEEIACDRAGALCARAGLRLVAFDWSGTPPPGRDLLARLHALARGAVPVFRLAAGDGREAAPLPRLDGFPGAVLLCARRGAALAMGEHPVLYLDIEPLSALDRCALWREALPELRDSAATLATRYLVEPAAAERIATDVRSMAALDGGRIDLDSVSACVRARAHARLTPGLDVRRPTAGWQQLVLPPARKVLLTEALQRLQQQATVLDRWRFLDGRPGARGVRVLLCGPPGTGKTLSAEVLANALGVDLLVVDIARLVSKWIGETEKHLAAVFDAAERSQAVLLFDEADALFGKRTDVSDAHDRYANLETAYLLARLERFEGLVMLSTNLKQNIDPAFLRRLEFVIELEQPGVTEREALWRCHLPPGAPLGADVNLKELATLYSISGGLIRNASVAAGFLAAAAGSAITRAHLIGAIAREYEKSGKAFPGAPAGLAPI